MFSRFRKNEKGQALVEMALVLPLLIILILGIIQFGIIFNNQVAVASAAREGARAASVGATQDEINAAVNNALSSSALLQNVNTVITPLNRQFGQPTTVLVTARTTIIVPFLDLLLGESYEHSSEAVMRVEYVQEGA